MSFAAERIQRALDREIHALESDDSLTQKERSEAILDLERSARDEYFEARAQQIDENDRNGGW
jgi:hypothetical protein